MKELSAAIPAHLLHQPKEVERKNVMGKDDFLKLLMTQLKNQDPLNPKTNEEFAAQLAQFSSLEQLTNIGKGIGELKTGMGAEDRTQALNMIGKEVKASGSQVQLVQGQNAALSFAPNADTTPVRASIYSRSGQLVREMDLSGLRPKESAIPWDGKDHEGKPLPAGTYTYRVYGVDGKGQSRELNAELSGRVIGVEMEGQEPVLVVKTGAGDNRIELDKVTSVSVGGGDSPPNKNDTPVIARTMPIVGTVATSPEAASEPEEAGSGIDTDPMSMSESFWRSFVEDNTGGRYR